MFKGNIFIALWSHSVGTISMGSGQDKIMKHKNTWNFVMHHQTLNWQKSLPRFTVTLYDQKIVYFQDKRFRNAFFAIALCRQKKHEERSRSNSTCSSYSTSINKNISTSIEITNSMKNQKLIRKNAVCSSKNFQQRRNSSVKLRDCHPFMNAGLQEEL